MCSELNFFFEDRLFPGFVGYIEIRTHQGLI